MLRLKVLFPDHWEYIIAEYREFVLSSGGNPIKDDLLLMIIESGVRFGERLAQIDFINFTEICCGLAIPSLTLAFLGRTGGKAIDIDPKILSFAERIRDRLECDLEFQCLNIFENRPQIKKGDLLIAEKPASYKKNLLEVEYNIRNWSAIEGINLALIPSINQGDTITTYSERCEKYEKKLKQVGFKVENSQIFEKLPYRYVIAVK